MLDTRSPCEHDKERAYAIVRRTARALIALALSIGFASSGCTGGSSSGENASPIAPTNLSPGAEQGLGIELGATPAACPLAPEPCGGEVAGSWVLHQACFDSNELYRDDPCVMLRSRRIRATGGIFVRADHSVESTVFGEISDALEVGPSCVSSCPDITFERGAVLCQASAGGTGCACAWSLVSRFDPVFPDGIEQLLRAGDYCVVDDRLFVADPDIESGVAIVLRRIPPYPDDGLPTLAGAEVHYTAHCCTGVAGESNRTTERLTAEVTTAVEFPAFGYYGVGSISQVQGSIDIEPTRVKVTYRESSTLLESELNAFRLVFQGGRFERIRSARLAADSFAPGLSPVVSFEERTLLINARGGPVADGDTITVDLELE